MVILDIICYAGEKDMLKLRLAELKDKVDYHIIVEAKYTFTRIEKLLKFNIDDFPEYADRIIYLTINSYPLYLTNAWSCEEYHRNYPIFHCKNLSTFNNETIVIMCDIDEIPSDDVFDYIKNNQVVEPITLSMDFYYYNFKWIKQNKWMFAYISSLGFLRKNSPNIIRQKFYGRVGIIPNAGWHLSYFMTVDEIINKLRSFSHTEYNKEQYLDRNNIQHAIDNGLDLFKRDNENLIPSNNRLPNNFKLLPDIFWK